MTRRLRSTPVLGVIACLCSAAAGRAQTSDAEFHASANLVQVDAVVTDAKGHHISNLTKEDFEVMENGSLQKISTFAWVPVRGEGDDRRSIVLVIDDNSLPGPWALEAKDVAKKFIAQEMGAHDLVAVMSTINGLGWYQQFTSDKSLLYAALDRITGKPRFAALTGGQSLAGLPGIKVDEPREIALFHELLSNTGPAPDLPHVPGSIFTGVGAAPLAIQGLRGRPGRKAVVFFSHTGFPATPAMSDMAIRSGVVIYDIDPLGNALNPALGSDKRARYRAPGSALVEQTGGLWFNSGPGHSLLGDLRSILDDISGYYLIGYLRPESEATAGARDVQVNVLRPKLSVRFRNGFSEKPEAGASASDQVLRRALYSPQSAGGIRMRLDPVFAASPPDPKTQRRLPMIRVALAIDGHDLHFASTDGGQPGLALDVLVGVYNKIGMPVTERKQSFQLRAKPESAVRMPESSVHYFVDLTLSEAGSYQVRAAVLDQRTGEAGAAYSIVTVPEFGKPGIALSSLALAPAGGTAWNEYAPGATVDFGCEVFGLTAAPSGKPNVEMQVRLLQGGATVYEGPVIHVEPAAVDGENLLAGRMTLGMNLEPGDYTMQLVAWDRLADPKKQMALRQTDLTVVRR